MAYTPSHTITGTACYSGIAGTFVTTVHASDKTVLQGAAMTRTTPSFVLEDGAGNPVSEGFGRPQDTLDIEFTPVSTTQALAAAEVELPTIGTKVTLGDTGIADYNGDWNYLGNARIIPQAKGPVKITMTVSRKGPVSGGRPTAMDVAS